MFFLATRGSKLPADRRGANRRGWALIGWAAAQRPVVCLLVAAAIQNPYKSEFDKRESELGDIRRRKLWVAIPLN